MEATPIIQAKHHGCSGKMYTDDKYVNSETYLDTNAGTCFDTKTLLEDTQKS